MAGDYINLGGFIALIALIIGLYVHTDKKNDKLSGEIRILDDKLSNRIDKLSDEIKENNKSLNDRIDRLYDILVHMGFREERIHRDKAANE